MEKKFVRVFVPLEKNLPNEKSMESLLQEDFNNDKKVSKNCTINKDQISPLGNSVNFSVDKTELRPSQIEFIRTSLLNHFIFKDMSYKIM